MDNANGHTENQRGSTIDQQLREKENAAFLADLQAIQEKHNRVIVPIIVSSKFGIFPDMKTVTKEEYVTMMGKLGFQPVEEPKG